jgi:amino acid transporter
MIRQPDGTSPEGQLLRVLGLGFGVAVALGAVIGAGILRGPGEIAGALPSPWLMLGLWVAGGAHAAMSANNVCELAAAMPHAGGFYVYSRRAYGPGGGILVGWSDWINITASIASLSIVFAEFLALLVPAAGAHKTLIALGALGALTGLNGLGVREGGRFQTASSALKGAALLGFCLLVFAAALAGRASAPHAAAAMGAPLTLAGVIGAYQIIVGAYGGWEAPAAFAEEHHAPGRTIPRALLLGVGLSILLYVLVNLALILALPGAALTKSTFAVADALSALWGRAGYVAAVAAGMLTVLSCLNSQLMQAPRVLYGLARDGLFPALGLRVNAGGTPSASLWLTAVIAAALSATGSFDFTFALLAAMVVVSNVMTDGALFILRRRAPTLERPYRARFYPLLPALALCLDLALFVLFVAGSPASGAIALALIALSAAAAWMLARRRASRGLGGPL